MITTLKKLTLGAGIFLLYSTFTPKPPAPQNILFIGNSFTNGGPIPELVEKYASKSHFRNVKTTNLAINGHSLTKHKQEEKVLEALTKKWDAIVLQDYSLNPTSKGDPEEFQKSIAWYTAKIKEQHPLTKIILYETWAREKHHELYGDSSYSPQKMQKELYNNYSKATKKNRNILSPVGEVWQAYLKESDTAKLHLENEGYHANKSGQKLAAFVLYNTLFDEKIPQDSLTKQEKTFQKILDEVQQYVKNDK